MISESRWAGGRERRMWDVYHSRTPSFSYSKKVKKSLECLISYKRTGAQFGIQLNKPDLKKGYGIRISGMVHASTTVVCRSRSSLNGVIWLINYSRIIWLLYWFHLRTTMTNDISDDKMSSGHFLYSNCDTFTQFMRLSRPPMKLQNFLPLLDDL